MLSTKTTLFSARVKRLNCYLSVRNDTTDICLPLAIEDHAVQPNAEVSPPKWHLGHTTWFFEELVLVKFMPGYVRCNEQYRLLFNSYYKSAGKHWIQGERGNLSRPTLDEVLAYRAYVDHHMQLFLQSDVEDLAIQSEIDNVFEIGLHHEQQHQELLYMDIKCILGVNPLPTTYNDICQTQTSVSKAVASWQSFTEGVYKIGHNGDGFAYDNESPRHKTYIYPFAIANNTVSNGEYLQFINDQGYSTARYWLSLGWDWLAETQVKCPLYWLQEDDIWYEFTLHGRHVLDLNAPVTHISYFEADAFASWKGGRLPTEQEFEVYLQQTQSEQAPVTGRHQPHDTSEVVGQVWCWTRSQYTAYPGFEPYKGVLEEYNGKFMCNQFVLKGGCVATPLGHYRHSYRNFYQAHQRWMFSGIRICKDL